MVKLTGRGGVVLVQTFNESGSRMKTGALTDASFERILDCHKAESTLAMNVSQPRLNFTPFGIVFVGPSGRERGVPRVLEGAGLHVL